MRPRISIRGSVRRSVCWSVGNQFFFTGRFYKERCGALLACYGLILLLRPGRVCVCGVRCVACARRCPEFPLAVAVAWRLLY